MRKMLFILGILVQWTSISFSQEYISSNDGFNFVFNDQNLYNYNLVRTDQEGYVVWTFNLIDQNTPFDTNEYNYIIVGSSNVQNGKITYNPSDYDYWLIPREEKIKFSTYPNPTRGIINICASFVDNKTRFEITDAVNRLIYSDRINNIITNLDLSEESKGIYFIRIFDNEKTLKFEKICLN